MNRLHCAARKRLELECFVSYTRVSVCTTIADSLLEATLCAVLLVPPSVISEITRSLAQAKDKARPTSNDLPPAPGILDHRTLTPHFTQQPTTRPRYRYSLASPALLLLYAAPRLQACIARRRTGSPETRQHTTDNIAADRLLCTGCTTRLLHSPATHERLS